MDRRACAVTGSESPTPSDRSMFENEVGVEKDEEEADMIKASVRYCLALNQHRNFNKLFEHDGHCREQLPKENNGPSNLIQHGINRETTASNGTI